MEGIDDEGLQWIYVAPRHKLVEENLNNFDLSGLPFAIKRKKVRQFNFVHLKGRDKLCLRAEVKAAMNIYEDAQESWCESCEHRSHNTCPYYKMWAEIEKNKPRIACMHSHFHTRLFQDFLPANANYYNVVIIDENPFTSLFEETSANGFLLTEACSLVNQMEDVGDLKAILQNVLSNYMESEYKVDYEFLGSYLGGDFVKLNKAFKEQLLNFPHPTKEMVDAAKFVRVFLNTLGLYIGDEDKLKRAMYISDYYNKKTLNVLSFKGSINIPRGVNVIGLDATSTKEMWEFAVQRPVQELAIDYPLKNVVMFNGGRLSQGSWMSYNSKLNGYYNKISDTGRAHANELIRIVDHSKTNVTVCCSKRVHSLVSLYAHEVGREDALKRMKFAVYYALRGSNEFNSCDTIVLLHVPRRPPDSLRSHAMLSDTSEEMWERMDRECEMRQAIGRVRPAMEANIDGDPRDVHIYVFPNSDCGVFSPEERKQMLLSQTLTEIPSRYMPRYLDDEMPNLLSLVPTIGNKGIATSKLAQLCYGGRQFSDQLYRERGGKVTGILAEYKTLEIVQQDEKHKWVKVA